MVKKILSLTVAIMLFSVTALAIVTATPELVQASEPVTTVGVVSNPGVVDGALTGSAQLKITPAENKNDVTVVTGVFSTEGEFLGAAVETAFNLEAGVAAEKTIAMPTVSATEDSKYVVNFYLWEKSTLAPLTGVTSITVEPAVLDIEPLEVLWKDHKGENKLGDGEYFTATENGLASQTAAAYQDCCRITTSGAKITTKITRPAGTAGKYNLYLYTTTNGKANPGLEISVNSNVLGNVKAIYRSSVTATLPDLSEPIEITLNEGVNEIEFTTAGKRYEFYGYRLEYVGSN